MKPSVLPHLVAAILVLTDCVLPLPLEEAAGPRATDQPRPTGSAEAPVEAASSTITPSLAPNTSLSSAPEQAIVTQVIDGDTIDVSIDGEIFRVRYIGINAPEWDDECGREATQANADLVAGREVILVRDVSETDRYGRLLRYVYVDEMMVNAQLVADGWAQAVMYPPDVTYADGFAQLGTEAREGGRGC